ncbi:MAG TPA: hypothetical protein VGE55_00810 [Limnobacter sp.]|uniref:hypothetical protein n=1 Tax=Limnobacter sp. TaxID=2003368 RepID=UPI002EDB3BA1
MTVLSKNLRIGVLALGLSLGLFMGHARVLLAAAPAEVGTIIDLKGNAQAKPGGVLAPLDFLTEGSTVELAAGAKITLTLYKQGTEYAVTGPATFQVGITELKSIKGNAPVLVPKATKQSARNVNGGAAERNAGAVIMRSVGSSQPDPLPSPAPTQSPTSTNGAQK